MILFKKIIYKISQIYFYNSYSFLQRLRIFFSINQKIKIGRLLLTLPPYHLFSLYKKRYKKYDNFLVHLAKNLKNKDSLIDVGANVGDTLFQIISKNNNFNYYCIEGDKFFSSSPRRRVRPRAFGLRRRSDRCPRGGASPRALPTPGGRLGRGLHLP